MFTRLIPLLFVAPFLSLVAGCETNKPTADSQSGMLEKQDSYETHGQISTFYGHSAGH
jgi:hypothetical protein